MLNININEEEKRIYINVSGYITKREANNFLNTYKQTVRNKKPSLYKLILQPEYFECEDDEDIKKVCMTFYKSGFKKMYLVDKDNFIMNNLTLNPLERKLFSKAVKVVSTMDLVK